MGKSRKEKKSVKHSYSHKRADDDEKNNKEEEHDSPNVVEVKVGKSNEVKSPKRGKRLREASEFMKLTDKDVSSKDDSDDTSKEAVTNEKNQSETENAVPSKKQKLSREERKQLKETLLEKIPKVDENGISYTKIEIRRMLKRVKRGLAAVPSNEEKEKLEKERRDEKEKEKREWDDMIYGDGDGDGDGDGAKKSETNDAILSLDDKNEVDENLKTAGTSDSDEKNSSVRKVDAANIAPEQKGAGKEKKKKPVPADYICQACKNDPACGDPHWIYDCPQKKRMPGTNNVRKKERGIIQPDTKHKVFVSGLPFHVSHMAVEAFFRKKLFSRDEEPSNTHDKKKLVRCKLVLFRDTLECRGQAFVMFASSEMTKKALELDGIEWETLKKDSTEGKRWLKIEPVKGRTEMRSIKRHKKWQEQTKLRNKAATRSDIHFASSTAT